MRRKRDKEIKEFLGRMQKFSMEKILSEELLTEKYQLSDRFYRNMEQIINRQQKMAKKREVFQGIAASAAVLLLLVGIFNSRLIVDAGETLVWNYMDRATFQFEWNADVSHIPRYKLQYVPQGYTLISDQYYGICGFQKYKNQTGNSLCFFYMPIDVTLDIESKDKELITVLGSGNETLYYLKAQKNGEESFLVWESKDKTVKFNLSGELTEAELLEIQSNMKTVKEEKEIIYEEEK